VEKRNLPFVQVTYAQTENEYQGQGCFRYLLLQALTKYQNILSDHHQTKEAELAWKSLIKFPSGKMEIFVYDELNDKLLPTKNIPESKIWNEKEIPILLISLVKYPQLIQERLDADDIMKKQHNRNYNNIWFGHSTYFNP
jgi:hypothetical protein